MRENGDGTQRRVPIRKRQQVEVTITLSTKNLVEQVGYFACNGFRELDGTM